MHRKSTVEYCHCLKKADGCWKSAQTIRRITLWSNLINLKRDTGDISTEERGNELSSTDVCLQIGWYHGKYIRPDEKTCSFHRVFLYKKIEKG